MKQAGPGSLAPLCREGHRLGHFSDSPKMPSYEVAELGLPATPPVRSSVTGVPERQGVHRSRVPPRWPLQLFPVDREARPGSLLQARGIQPECIVSFPSCLFFSITFYL